MIRTNAFNPQDPMEWVDYADDNGNPDGEWIYSERDQREFDELLALDLRDEHHARMRQFVDQFSSARIHLEGILGAMERAIVEARANNRWDYNTAPKSDTDPTPMSRWDALNVRQVRMEAEQFGASHEISRWELATVAPEVMEQIQEHARDLLTLRLRAMVYGHRHPDITTRATKMVIVEVPVSTWWQEFKVRHLRRPRRTRSMQVDVHMAVSARPFSAFPQLPYAADPKWGPRIDLMLPSRPSITAYMDGKRWEPAP